MFSGCIEFILLLEQRKKNCFQNRVKIFNWTVIRVSFLFLFSFSYHNQTNSLSTNWSCVWVKRLIKIACNRSCDNLGYYPNISIPILPCVQLAGVYTYLFPIIETDIKRDIYFQFIAPSWTIELFRRNCEFNSFNSNTY